MEANERANIGQIHEHQEEELKLLAKADTRKDETKCMSDESYNVFMGEYQKKYIEIMDKWITTEEISSGDYKVQSKQKELDSSLRWNDGSLAGMTVRKTRTKPKKAGLKPIKKHKSGKMQRATINRMLPEFGESVYIQTRYGVKMWAIYAYHCFVPVQHLYQGKGRTSYSLGRREVIEWRKTEW